MKRRGLPDHCADAGTLDEVRSCEDYDSGCGTTSGILRNGDRTPRASAVCGPEGVLSAMGQILYSFSPAYAADVAPVLGKGMFRASAMLSIVQSLSLLPWCAVLPLVFVCDVAVTAVAYRRGLKEAWI